jgi:hypothetical protein
VVVVVSTVAAATVAVVIWTNLHSSNPSAPRASTEAIGTAHAVLIHEATLAAAQEPLVPGPGQLLYVQTTSGSISGAGLKTAMWNYYVQDVTQEWTSPWGINASVTFATGQPQFLTEADRSAWLAAGSPPIEIGGGGSLPAVYYDVTDLPTDSSQMASYIAIRTQIPGGSNPRPVSQFDVATQFLIHGASSAQRAALFQYMATLPGVKNLGVTQALGSGKSGETLAVLGTQGRQVEVVIDSSTTEILEQRVVVSDPDQLGAGLYPPSMQTGETLSYTDFVYAGITDTPGSAPNGAPPIPTAWLPNTSRSPLSAAAYPIGN